MSDSAKDARKLVEAVSKLTPEQVGELLAKDKAIAIYQDLKWKLRIRDYTPKELADLFDEMIETCKREIKHPQVCAKAVGGFLEMRNRTLEHLTEEPVTHICDDADETETACCGKKVLDLSPTDKLTKIPGLATCPGALPCPKCGLAKFICPCNDEPISPSGGNLKDKP